MEPPAWFVESIRQHGVQESIIVRRGPTVRGQIRYEVVDGRQRVLAARLVNKERKAASQMPIVVKCDVFRGTEVEAARMIAVLNEHRVPVDARTKAETAAQALKFGASEQQVCNDNNWTKADLRRYLDLLECVPEVQTAVQEGRLALAAVPKLRQLERADQVEQVAALTADDKIGPREVAAVVGRAKPEVAAPRMRRRATIEAKAGELAALTSPNRSQAGMLAALRWVLGESEDITPPRS